MSGHLKVVFHNEGGDHEVPIGPLVDTIEDAYAWANSPDGSVELQDYLKTQVDDGTFSFTLVFSQ